MIEDLDILYINKYPPGLTVWRYWIPSNEINTTENMNTQTNFSANFIYDKILTKDDKKNRSKRKWECTDRKPVLSVSTGSQLSIHGTIEFKFLFYVVHY